MHVWQTGAGIDCVRTRHSLLVAAWPLRIPPPASALGMASAKLSLHRSQSPVPKDSLNTLSPAEKRPWTVGYHAQMTILHIMYPIIALVISHVSLIHLEHGPGTN